MVVMVVVAIVVVVVVAAAVIVVADACLLALHCHLPVLLMYIIFC